MKIGILGGSFNPPHVGHLIIAECARVALRLDKIFFIPCNQPPHKRHGALAEAKDRLAMVRLSVRGNPYFKVLDNEINRKSVSYTVDTLQELKYAYPHTALFLIMGADLSKGFHRWKAPRLIKRLARVAVMNRGKQSAKFKGAHSLTMPRIDISSSLIRARIKRKQSIRYLVPEGVREYIEKKWLYR